MDNLRMTVYSLPAGKGRLTGVIVASVENVNRWLRVEAKIDKYQATLKHDVELR